MEKNTRTAHKSRVSSEKGPADEVVVVLLLVSSRELFFFALFRAFVGVVLRDVSSNKGQTLIREKGLHFVAVVREKKKKGFAFVRRTLLLLRTLF